MWPKTFNSIEQAMGAVEEFGYCMLFLKQGNKCDQIDTLVLCFYFSVNKINWQSQHFLFSPLGHVRDTQITQSWLHIKIIHLRPHLRPVKSEWGEVAWHQCQDDSDVQPELRTAFILP